MSNLILIFQINVIVIFVDIMREIISTKYTIYKVYFPKSKYSEDVLQNI